MASDGVSDGNANISGVKPASVIFKNLRVDPNKRRNDNQDDSEGLKLFNLSKRYSGGATGDRETDRSESDSTCGQVGVLMYLPNFVIVGSGRLRSTSTRR